jgi:hypothetical protein
VTTLTKGEYAAGVSEHQTRFVVGCRVCKREEMRGALPNPLDIDAERSPSAKRLRASCKGNAPLPCRFTHQGRVVALSHAQALDAGLCMSAPVLRLQGDDGDIVFATKLNRPATQAEAVALAEMAQRAFDALGEGL